MGDIDNDVKCSRDGCGHLASAHGNTDDGSNNGSCSMKGCDCSSMKAPSGDASAAATSLGAVAEMIRPGDPELVADLTDAVARAGHGLTVDDVLTLSKLPADGCYRTGCPHPSSKHLDLDSPLAEGGTAAGVGKCMAEACSCAAYMPKGAPGEPQLPEPTVLADGAPAALAAEPEALAADDGEPGEPGGGPDDDPANPDMEGFPFRALLVQEGVETCDDRFIEPNATTWRTLPLSLGYQDKTEHGGMADTAAVNIGRIDAITREPGEMPGTFDIWGTGVIDKQDPAAVMAAHKIAGKFLKGVSVDLAINSAEVEVTAVDDDGWPIGERFIVTDCVIGMATVTSFPAFGDCQIELTGEEPSEAEEAYPGLELPKVGDRIPIIADASTPGESFTWHLAEPEHVEVREMIPMTASGGPMAPPRDWFEQPEFSPEDLQPIAPHFCGGRRGVVACPLTILDDGRVFGHLASWHVTHLAAMNQGRTMRAPRNAGYDLFNNRGVVRCEDGSDMPTGVITLSGGHADLRMDAYRAMQHYDDTRSAVIDCRVGPDALGIWVAGALRPDVDELTLRRLRAASISGDWRPFGARHEFVAACSVNVPGLPTMRQAIAASAFMDEEDGLPLVALVAAGALPTREQPTTERLLARAADELAAVRREREADRLARIIG